MKIIISFIVLSLLLCGCAKQGTLIGGTKDTTAPVVDTLKSTPNYTTQFNQRKIELTFNEWVVLKDITKEILVSPPLEKRPTFTLKKKTVVVDFGEKPVFRPNTTYTINFGGAVRDLHEGNAAKDLRYVFSTGVAIDSLQLEGIATDALTGDPLENITVMLYDQMYDSVVLKEKPYYFARTDKGGLFSIKNIKPGTFKSVAIDEGQAADLKWNPGNERIGFSGLPVVLSDSVGRVFVPIVLFKNQGIVRTTDKNALNYGVVRIGWTDTPPTNQEITIGAEALNAGMRYAIENSKDSTFVWYDFPADTVTKSWSLTIKDTVNKVSIKSFRRNDFAVRHRLRPAEEGAGTAVVRGRGGRALPPPVPTQLAPKNIPVLPGRTGTLRFNFPIASLDTAQWKVLRDTLAFRNFTLTKDSLNSRALVLSGDWKPGTNLAVTVLPGGLTDFYGLANVDTILYNVNIVTDKQLSSINLTVESVKPGMAYVVEIFNGTVKEAERRFTATETTFKIPFKELLAATYTVKITEDSNANGRWDTGNYFEHQQPERIFTKKLDALRANWELEASITAEKDDGKRK